MWLHDKSLNVQTVLSRALSPSPTHSGSFDDFSLDPEISGDESDNETMSTSCRKEESKETESRAGPSSPQKSRI